MQRIKAIIISIIFSLLSMSLVGQTKKALIIGNDNYHYYKFPDLQYSIRGCYELSEILLSKGYEVNMIMNASRYQMLKSLDEFFDKESSISLFYYSGHTYKSEFNGDIYLVPTDAKINDSFIEADLIRINDIRYSASSSASQINILMIDIAKGHLFESENIQKDVQMALSANYGEDNTIILSNNNLQNTPNEPSYLLQFFLQELEKPNQTIRRTFENIQLKSIGNPFLNTSLSLGSFTSTLLWNGENQSTTSGNKDIMPSFPFPPPKASTSYVIDKKYLLNLKNLFEVGQILDNTLKSCGYRERSYYQIPEGFALVTRIEKIELDATPSPVPDRWNAPHKEGYDDFSIKDYFRSLFFAKKGKYRIIVFLVTSIPFSQTESQMAIIKAQQYVKGGYNSLPTDFQIIEFTRDYECTALIYEFDKVEFEEGVQVEFSKYLGFDHLMKNNFIPILIKGPK